MNSQSLSARLPEAAREWGCTGLGIVSKVPRNKWSFLSLPSRLSQPFQSAHNKCARHRMQHLPPQIRAPMGRQIASAGGSPGGECAPRLCPVCLEEHVGMPASGPSASKNVSVRVSVPRQSARVRAPEHTRGECSWRVPGCGRRDARGKRCCT